MKNITLSRFAILTTLILIILSSCQEKVKSDEMTENVIPDSLNKALKIELPDGFVAEHLHCPSDSLTEQGSWVSMTTDEDGRLIASDQYGYLYRLTPAPVGVDSPETKIEKLEVKLGHAQGLLWAFNSLYVVVNAGQGGGIEGHSSGLYRVIDSDMDGELDSVMTLKKLHGAGEHGPHAILLAPDKKSLYVIGGNHTELPEGYTSLVPGWDEDNLLPVIKDPRGHAVSRKAPGGWVARTDPFGKQWELISVGYRNPYDMAFNEDGELFIFDSDMEWDMGMPWYRPIRVCHVTSASEYGWRTGTGKWPVWYPDALPPIVNIGQGSPTGIFMGKGLNFPTRFQKGLFIMDWSFGTMYFIDITPEGSSYKGKKEEFLSGVPLPLTDGLVGADGNMYFLTGGRRLGSDLYRVYYAGDEDTSPPEKRSGPEDEQRSIRLMLERFHEVKDETAADFIWPYLDHEDRFIRYAARIALENQNINSWLSKLWPEEEPQIQVQAAIAFARQGSSRFKTRVVNQLTQLAFEQLSPSLQLDLLRAYGLIFSRMGPPNAIVKRGLVTQVTDHYPAKTNPLNRELCLLLSYLNVPEVIPKTLALLEGDDQGERETYLSQEVSERHEVYGKDIQEMLAKMPPAQEMAYVNYLSHVTNGWTLEYRRKYFQWFFNALNKQGGRSYKGFLDQIRYQALQKVPRSQLAQIADLSGQVAVQRTRSLGQIPRAKGPGKNWNKQEVRRIFRRLDEQKNNFRNGKRMFAAAMCSSCHVMRDEGNNIGPNLTQVATKFSDRDLLETILSPSAAVSDQYAATIFTLNDSSKVVGRIISENEQEVAINQNPYEPEQKMVIAKSDIKSQAISPVSIMPPGLINRLNETELRDLLAYLMAGGDEEHELFKEPVPEEEETTD